MGEASGLEIHFKGLCSSVGKLSGSCSKTVNLKTLHVVFSISLESLHQFLASYFVSANLINNQRNLILVFYL